VNNCTNCQTKLQTPSCQIPNMPPPPPPPYTNMNQFCGINNVPPSTASVLRNKDSFTGSHGSNSDRFSSFRAGEFRLPPVPARREEISRPLLQKQEENQYLQPEWNTYSMVDSEYQSESQYYCDEDVGGQDLNSNMYSEVLEDYMEEPNSSIGNCRGKQQPLSIQNKLNASYFKNLKSKQSSKYKILCCLGFSGRDT